MTIVETDDIQINKPNPGYEYHEVARLSWRV
jgi:hypothetical protein